MSLCEYGTLTLYHVCFVVYIIYLFIVNLEIAPRASHIQGRAYGTTVTFKPLRLQGPIAIATTVGSVLVLEK